MSQQETMAPEVKEEESKEPSLEKHVRVTVQLDGERAVTLTGTLDVQNYSKRNEPNGGFQGTVKWKDGEKTLREADALELLALNQLGGPCQFAQKVLGAKALLGEL